VGNERGGKRQKHQKDIRRKGERKRKQSCMTRWTEVGDVLEFRKRSIAGGEQAYEKKVKRGRDVVAKCSALPE